MEISAFELATLIGGKIEGDANVKVRKPAKIEEAGVGDFSFADGAKYENLIYQSHASVVLVSDTFVPSQPISCTLIRVPHIRQSLAFLLEQFGNTQTQEFVISPDARIDSTATLGANVGVGTFSIISAGANIGDSCLIHEQVYIGPRVQVGRGTVIYPGVKIYHDCIIGDYCVIHANAVIGADGFGFIPQPDGSWKKLPQVGNVVIGNQVDIGVSTCIDRAALGSTTIADGVKLDNLVHIAHNVSVGANTAMAAQVGVAGSAVIGANCMIGGQTGIAGHITLANGTKTQAQSGVGSTIKEENKAVFGSPAIAYQDYVKAYMHFKKLPEMERRLRRLEKELDHTKPISEE